MINNDDIINNKWDLEESHNLFVNNKNKIVSKLVTSVYVDDFILLNQRTRDLILSFLISIDELKKVGHHYQFMKCLIIIINRRYLSIDDKNFFHQYFLNDECNINGLTIPVVPEKKAG